VAILGSYDVFEKTGRAQAVSVSAAFAPVITTADIPPENRRQVLADRVHAVIARNLAEAQAASEAKTGPENKQP
jgi:hypothetical protein